MHIYIKRAFYIETILIYIYIFPCFLWRSQCGLRCSNVIRRALRGFYRLFHFVLFPVQAGESRLEDKVPREFSGLAPFGEKASGTTRCGRATRAADKYISRLNPAFRRNPRNRATSILRPRISHLS